MQSDRENDMSISAIIPAYNEEGGIARVIAALKSAPVVSEIIVVDDGSDDTTAHVAEQGGAHVIRQKNQGKAAAMAAGARAAKNKYILFCDADLVGFTARHICELTRPVQEGDAGMTVGIRDRGRFIMWLMEHVLPIIGGERVIARDIFLTIAKHPIANRFGIETVMNAYCKKQRIPVRLVRLPGLTQVIKESKYGVWVGLFARTRMITDIIKTEIALLFDTTL